MGDPFVEVREGSSPLVLGMPHVGTMLPPEIAAVLNEAGLCVPDTDCDDCRHYAAGSAVVTARMYRHASDPEHFAAWLDYVDTYLAVWVRHYEKDANLLPAGASVPLKEDALILS